MTRDQTRTQLQDKITKTLLSYQDEQTATSSQAFDIIRWARAGYLMEALNDS